MSSLVEIWLSVNDRLGVAGGRLRVTPVAQTGRGVDVGLGGLVTDMQKICRLGRVENDGGWGRLEPCSQASQHVCTFQKEGCSNSDTLGS
jgi:hypothetical protein